MAYGEYRKSGRCPGKCLYQLSKLGIPLYIVETVIFNGDQSISYRGKPFATYEWLDDDTPIFKFDSEYATYNDLQKAWRALYRPTQEFVILGRGAQHVDACAQFSYKGYQVSMSTIGRSEGACANPVAVFNSFDGDGYHECHVADFSTAEEAIRYIDGDSTIVPIRVSQPITHEIEFITGD